MASPIPTGKQTVNLASGARVSRIRRDPPPVVKASARAYPGERDRAVVIAGVVAFALALVAVAIGLASAAGWSPSQYVIDIRD